jgi:hypothetical protein
VVLGGCIELLSGGDVDADLILALGGPPASWVITGEPSGPPYWMRVWATRGLLWAWDDVALPAVKVALSDEAWRVREVALKVVARHRLEDTLPTVADLREDPAARVRAAASRALHRLEDTLPTVADLREDPAARVRAAASRALMRLETR